MAKDKTPTVVEDEELEELTDEVEEDEDEVEEDEIVTPKMLADELEISPKTLRGFLRKTFPRSSNEKNTSWRLTDAQVEAARDHFIKDEDDEEDEETEVEVDES